MCSSDEYNVFPSVTIGGPPGLYKVRCPVQSKEIAEYFAACLSNAAGTAATILISGTDIPPATFDTSGATTYDDIGFLRFQAYIVGVNVTVTPNETWEQITSPQGYVFIRILSSTASFVTLKWREKILKAIPAPARTVNPEMKEQYHQERGRRIEQMVLGKEGEIEEYGQRPGQLAKIRRF